MHALATHFVEGHRGSSSVLGFGVHGISRDSNPERTGGWLKRLLHLAAPGGEIVRFINHKDRPPDSGGAALGLCESIGDPRGNFADMTAAPNVRRCFETDNALVDRARYGRCDAGSAVLPQPTSPDRRISGSVLLPALRMPKPLL
jgi:hypothetical protein